MATVDLPMGCILDRSHASALDLDKAIVGLAELHGFPHHGAWPSGAPYDRGDEEYPDLMRELADEAVAWMNDRLPTGDTFLAVDDNSLMHWYADDDGVA